tara:strand:+ start:3438 stop:3860 length:423 start_codon:yes stop_codon:yes gene_type:complete
MDCFTKKLFKVRDMLDNGRYEARNMMDKLIRDGKNVSEEDVIKLKNHLLDQQRIINECLKGAHNAGDLIRVLKETEEFGESEVWIFISNEDLEWLRSHSVMYANVINRERDDCDARVTNIFVNFPELFGITFKFWTTKRY